MRVLQSFNERAVRLNGIAKSLKRYGIEKFLNEVSLVIDQDLQLAEKYNLETDIELYK